MDTVTSQTETAEPKTGETIVDEFAVVEIFGHRRLAGRITEVERFGTKMLRVDVPTEGDFAKGYTSQFYGGSSLFSVTPCTLETVQTINRPYRQPGLMAPKAEEPDGHVDDLESDGDDDDDGGGPNF